MCDLTPHDRLPPSNPLPEYREWAGVCPRCARARRGFARIGVHLLLLSIAAAFLFPFAWMVLTSAKTDEEIAEGKWLPSLPVFQAASPYQTTDVAGKPVEASLEIITLQVRTLDAQIENIAPEWRVESGAGTLQPQASGLRVSYDFTSTRAPIVLAAGFPFPCDPADLHKLILAIKPDDSWHRLDIELTVAGQTWRSSRSTYLAQHRPLSLIFQPPTFEDDTLQPRTWVVLEGSGLRAPGSGKESALKGTPTSEKILNPELRTLNPSRPRTPNLPATLRIMLTPSSTPRAVWGKFTRNYVRMFNAVPFWRYVLSSVILSTLVVFGTLLSSTFTAYAFARLRWPGRSVAFGLLLATMMLPAQVTMIPTFLIWRQLGWYNTLNPLWVPAFFGSAFFVFMMVQHMKTLPRELEEAARIDGLNYMQTWYYIILPQVKPAAAAVAVLAFLGAWNDFLGPLIYLRDQARFPLSLGLLAAQIEYRGDWSLIMAGNVLLTLPVIVIFFFFQRYFVQGVSAAGLK